MSEATIETLLKITSTEDTAALQSAGKEMDRTAEKGENLASSATHSAREMQHTQDAAAALSDLMSGRFGPAAINLTRGFSGFIDLLTKSPALLAAIGIPLVIEMFEKISAACSESAEVVKAREKEMAENTEQMSKRMEEALKKPADAESFITLLENFQKELDLLHKLQTAYDEVTAAKNKFADAQREQTIAQLKADEALAVSNAEGAGKPASQIEQIKAIFGNKIAAAENAKSTGAASEETNAAQQKLNEAQADLDANEKARADAEAEKQAADANRHAQLEAEQKAHDAKIKALEEKKKQNTLEAAQTGENDPENVQAAMHAADIANAAIDQQIQEANLQHGAVKRTIAAAEGPASKEQQEKINKLNTDYQVLQQRVEQLTAEFNTALTKENTVKIEAGTKTLETGDKGREGIAKARDEQTKQLLEKIAELQKDNDEMARLQHELSVETSRAITSIAQYKSNEYEKQQTRQAINELKQKTAEISSQLSKLRTNQ